MAFEFIFDFALLASTLGLGVLAGALLTEGAVLVPYWRTLPSEEFFRLHKVVAPRLFRFFAPITVFGSLAPMVAAGVGYVSEQAGQWSLLVAAVLALLMLGIYFGYFQSANARFASGSILAPDLRAELRRWAYWHWIRVCVAFGAFGASLVALGT